MIQLCKGSIGWIAIIRIVSIWGVTPIESTTLAPESKTATSESSSPALSYASHPVTASYSASPWDPRIGKAWHWIASAVTCPPTCHGTESRWTCSISSWHTEYLLSCYVLRLKTSKTSPPSGRGTGAHSVPKSFFEVEL